MKESKRICYTKYFEKNWNYTRKGIKTTQSQLKISQCLTQLSLTVEPLKILQP